MTTSGPLAEQPDAPKSEEESGKNGRRRPLTFSEKFKNICLGLAAVSALILGMANMLKGEPTAEKAWDTSQEAINKNRGSINELGDGLRKLHLMFVHMQGRMEGQTAAAMMLKIEKLEAENKRLKAAPPERVVRAQPSPPPAPPPKECREGWVEAGGRCRRVGKAVAEAVDEAREKAQLAKRKLEQERKLRKAAERAKVRAEQTQLPAPAPPRSLPFLPKKLDDAAGFKRGD